MKEKESKYFSSRKETELKCAICGEVGIKSTTCPKCGHFHEWGFDWKAVKYLQNKCS